MSAAGRPRLGALAWTLAWGVALDLLLARYLPASRAASLLGGLAPSAGVARATCWGLVAFLVGGATVTWPLARGGDVVPLSARALGGFTLAGLVLGLDALIPAIGWDPLRGPGFWVPLAVVLVVAALDVQALGRLPTLVSVEWLKLRRGRLFRMALLGTFVAALLGGLAYDPPATGSSGWSRAAAALGSGFWAAEVFLLVLGATAVSGEATGGTLKMIFPHAYRRSDWVVAKALVILLAGVLLGLVAAGTAVGQAAATDGLGDVTRELEPMFGEDRGEVSVFLEAPVVRGHLVEAITAALASLGTAGLVGVLLSCAFDGVVASLCVAFLLFAALKFGDVVLGLPRSALEGIFTWPPAEMRELLDRLGRALNERWDEGLGPLGLRLAASTGLAALLLGIHLLSRRDLQS